MNFNKVLILLAVVFAIFAGHTKADFWKDLGKRIERIGQNTRDATIQTLAVAQQAANVAATARGY